MAEVQRKTIALLLCGGTSLLDNSGVVRDIRKASDVAAWMAQMPELHLIADVKPVFLYGGTAFDVEPSWWQSIVKTVVKQYKSVDGFIVTQPIDAIPYTAAALSLMLRNAAKPIILTGAPDITKAGAKRGQSPSEVGIRANLVNALQVAVHENATVSVLYGNRLVRAATVLRRSEPTANLFESAAVEPMGRMDFGLKLEQDKQGRGRGGIKALTNLKTRIAHLTVVPSAVQDPLQSLTAQQLDGVFVSGQALSWPSPFLDRVVAAAKARKLPVGVYTHAAIPATKDYYVLSNMTPAMALVKFMWVLGQTTDHRAAQKLLMTDVTGEMLRLKVRER